MRVLTLVGAGGEARAAAVSAAMASWSRGLDIRLRFLDIGIEETVLPLPPAGEALEEVERALARERPALVILHGSGAPALAAAVTAAKGRVPLVRTGAGVRAGPEAGEERAADRLATLRIADGAEGLEVLRAEGLADGAGDVGPAGDPGWADRVVREILRVLREP